MVNQRTTAPRPFQPTAALPYGHLSANAVPLGRHKMRISENSASRRMAGIRAFAHEEIGEQGCRRRSPLNDRDRPPPISNSILLTFRNSNRSLRNSKCLNNRKSSVLGITYMYVTGKSSELRRSSDRSGLEMIGSSFDLSILDVLAKFRISKSLVRVSNYRFFSEDQAVQVWRSGLVRAQAR